MKIPTPVQTRHGASLQLPTPHFLTGVAGAIANAIYHATGKRIRDLPITPDKLL
ncbi:hypothetical protein [Scytonema hofmannii]|uniref:hypothetical protein n=1 Tax=Scytonema hofmannii TaxID=34078 RepID=UPI00034C5E76|nr:hypothetical protein [Scytonema hofmannii]